MPTEPRRPTTTRRRGRAAVAALTMTSALLAAAGPPPTIVDSQSATDDTVSLEPAARRTLDGTAAVTLTVGSAATGDVTVTWSLHAIERAADGTVSAGAPAAAGTPPRAARLRPGETGRFVASIPADGAPALLVAEVRGAAPLDSSPDGASPTSTTLATLLLPGPPAERVTATTIAAGDGIVRHEVVADRPTLATIRTRGRDTTTHPDRLLLPDAPLTLEGAAARWPAPSVITVTDERGEVASVTTGAGAFAVIAALLVLLAAGGLTLSVRHQRSAASELA